MGDIPEHINLLPVEKRCKLRDRLHPQLADIYLNLSLVCAKPIEKLPNSQKDKALSVKHSYITNDNQKNEGTKKI